jgi:hypothetical protein
MSYEVEVVVVEAASRNPQRGTAIDNKKLETVVNEDIRQFEEFFTAKVDTSGPLSGPERAILKTYLYWKTHPETHGQEEA